METNRPRFRDRRDAGRILVTGLEGYRSRKEAIVLGLPRGGVPVAYEVAADLELPLDVCIVRKLGVPGHEELAMGAIAGDGTRVIDPRVVEGLRLSDDTIDAVAQAEKRELDEREVRYRKGRRRPAIAGKIVILVDDGLATGASMRAAVQVVRAGEAKRVVVAVPVAPGETCGRLREDADEVVCLREPSNFQSVGSWYEDFGQTSDLEVEDLLEQAMNRS